MKAIGNNNTVGENVLLRSQPNVKRLTKCFSVGGALAKIAVLVFLHGTFV